MVVVHMYMYLQFFVSSSLHDSPQTNQALKVALDAFVEENSPLDPDPPTQTPQVR